MKVLSPHIAMKSLRFNKSLLNLPRKDRPLRAGVSSFGFSGTNAHIIIQEYSSPSTNSSKTSPSPAGALHELDRWLVLSAKSPAALLAQAKRLIDWLVRNPEVTWEDVCFTSQVGRTHFVHRLA